MCCYAAVCLRRRTLLLPSAAGVFLMSLLWFYSTSRSSQMGSHLLSSALHCLAVLITLASDFQQCSSPNDQLCDRQYRSQLATKHDEDMINVAVIFTKAASNPKLQAKFRLCIGSMLEHHGAARLQLRILGDESSQGIAEGIFYKLPPEQRLKAKLIFDDMDKLVAGVKESLGEDMIEYFRYNKVSYYGDYLFFMSLVMHTLFPSLSRLILLDADLKFRADISELWTQFDTFSEDNLIGIANEAQPVYRHVFRTFRQSNPHTLVGEPPPDGITGFNSGVLLLDLDKMRQSALYNSLLNRQQVQLLAEKYSFKGHLGDQDFYTLLSTEHKQLFYVLPCVWNRQLCRWWEANGGYQDVFPRYFDCAGPIKIYHGNCNSEIPND